MRLSLMIRTFLWLYSTIKNHGPLTRRRINELWMAEESLSDGNPMPRPTFSRYRDEIENLFSISIACDKKHRYYIENQKLTVADMTARLLMSALTTNLEILENKAVLDRVLLEPNPSAEVYLGSLLEAMARGRVLDIAYQRYEDSDVHHHRVEPYCVKQFHNRWYLLGRKSDSFFILLALDRIVGLRNSGETFVMDKHFDAHNYFTECYGAVLDQGMKAERVVLRAFGTEPHYLRDLKLHHSQREVAVGDNYSDFELYLRPTLDFVGKLLERGDRIKVLEPGHLADLIREKHLSSVKMYEEV